MTTKQPKTEKRIELGDPTHWRPISAQRLEELAATYYTPRTDPDYDIVADFDALAARKNSGDKP